MRIRRRGYREHRRPGYMLLAVHVRRPTASPDLISFPIHMGKLVFSDKPVHHLRGYLLAVHVGLTTGEFISFFCIFFGKKTGATYSM